VNSIKTGVVLVFVLGIGYGLFYFGKNLVAPPHEAPPEVAEASKNIAEPEIDLGGLGAPGDPASSLTLGGNTPSWNAGSNASSTPSPLGSAAIPPLPTSSATQNPSLVMNTQPRSKMGKAPSFSTTGTASSSSPLGKQAMPSLDRQSPVLPDASAFHRAWISAQAQIDQKQYQDALFSLSVWYNDRDQLPPNDRKRLLNRLDALAREVIYSTKHWIENPYTIRQGETLYDIARKYNIPWELLQKINGIEDPRRLVAGEKLKVVRGPFYAIVDLERREITLMVHQYYAGRFSFVLDSVSLPKTGTYQVQQKSQDPISAAPQSRPPLCWIDLGNNLRIQSIQGTALPEQGCIGLCPRDAADLRAILSLKSQVIIQR